MNKYSYALILVFGLSLTLLSQTKIVKDTLYLDENNLEVSQTTFNKKCDAAVFNCRFIKDDSIVVKKVNYNFYFGKISTNEFNNIRQHFNNKIAIKINKGESILIYHRDKLLSFKEGRRLDSLNSTKSEKITIKNIKNIKRGMMILFNIGINHEINFLKKLKNVTTRRQFLLPMKISGIN